MIERGWEKKKEKKKESNNKMEEEKREKEKKKREKTETEEEEEEEEEEEGCSLLIGMGVEIKEAIRRCFFEVERESGVKEGELKGDKLKYWIEAKIREKTEREQAKREEGRKNGTGGEREGDGEGVDGKGGKRMISKGAPILTPITSPITINKGDNSIASKSSSSSSSQPHSMAEIHSSISNSTAPLAVPSSLSSPAPVSTQSDSSLSHLNELKNRDDGKGDDIALSTSLLARTGVSTSSSSSPFPDLLNLEPSFDIKTSIEHKVERTDGEAIHQGQEKQQSSNATSNNLAATDPVFIIPINRDKTRNSNSNSNRPVKAIPPTLITIKAHHVQ